MVQRFSKGQCEQFAAAANPHQWLLVADNLHEQAVELYNRRGGLRLTRSGPEEPSITWDGTNRATFLLGAFALENLIKAFLVYEDPRRVADGTLAGDVCSHKLVELADKSALLPHKARDRWVFAAFENGNESWMRYPCGRRANAMELEAQMHDKLWNGYRRVMFGCGRKMTRLLARGWTDPYGVFGRWEMTGSWFA